MPRKLHLTVFNFNIFLGESPLSRLRVFGARRFELRSHKVEHAPFWKTGSADVVGHYHRSNYDSVGHLMEDKIYCYTGGPPLSFVKPVYITRKLYYIQVMFSHVKSSHKLELTWEKLTCELIIAINQIACDFDLTKITWWQHYWLTHISYVYFLYSLCDSYLWWLSYVIKAIMAINMSTLRNCAIDIWHYLPTEPSKYTSMPK